MSPLSKRRRTRRAGLLLASLAALLASGAALAGCTGNSPEPAPSASSGAEESTAPSGASATAANTAATIDEQPSRVYYEIFVRSFADSNGDGIGDLNGITGKLDYLQQLGVEGLWLTPINPSPSYHGYDVTDYYGINPQFGTMDDFKHLLDEAHKRGIDVIMDLDVNHTSSQHPWFVDSAKGKDSPYRDWYVWAEDNGLATSALSATGGQAWHEKNGSHYEGTFTDTMPDLNYDNPDVRKEIIKVANFWLDEGVDGFRLDAAKHIYENFKSQAGDQAVVQKNVAWWQEFRQGLKKPDAYLVSEVWSSSAAVAPYLNHAFDSSFNFDVSDWIRSAVVSDKASSMTNMLPRYYGAFAQQSDGAFVDAPFVDNHDRDRIMSLTRGNVGEAKVAASILLTLPGNPFIYYGDEIGMMGAGADERKREPIKWTAAGNGDGQTTSWEAIVSGRDQQVSVEAEENDPDSLLSHYRKLIALRKQEPALRNGGLESVKMTDQRVVAFVRLTADEKLYVAHNLTGEAVTVPVDDASAAAFKSLLFATDDGEGAADVAGSASYANGSLTISAYGTVILK